MAGTVNGDAGDVAMSAGNPETLTATEPAKPFCAATDTEKPVFDVPGVATMEIGEAARLKSGDGLMVSVMGVEWLIEPPVAVSVKGKLPIEVGTAREMVCVVPTGPLSGNAGEVTVPVGRPETASETGSEKPF